MSGRTRRSAGATRPICIHLRPAYEPPPDPPDYPFHDRTVRVTRCGRICIGKRKINLSRSLAGNSSAFAKSTTRSGSSASWTMI